MPPHELISTVNIHTPGYLAGRKKIRGRWINAGDCLSNPTLYFDFREPARHDLLSPSRDTHHLIVGGGGLFRSGKMISQLEEWTDRSSGKRIAWGVGHNQPVHSGDLQYPIRDHFDLFGVRDWEPGLKNENWVPCASCMHPLFDHIPEPDCRIVALFHLYEKVPDRQWFALKHPDIPIRMNCGGDPPEAMIRHVMRGSVIITNSYHGAYWGILAGRKVIVVDPYSTRFHHFRHMPAFAGMKDWTGAIARAKQYPQALETCRKRNREFHLQVQNLFKMDDSE